MARSAVRPGVFTGKQGQQGVNKLVIFAAVVGAVVVAGLPFISKEVRPACCLNSGLRTCTWHQPTKTRCWLGYAGAAPRAECAHDARRRDRRKGRGAQRAAEHQVTGAQEAALPDSRTVVLHAAKPDSVLCRGRHRRMRCGAARLRSAARCLTAMSTVCGAPSRQPCAASAAATSCGPACSPSDLSGRGPVASAESVDRKHASTAARTQPDDVAGGRSGGALREASPGAAKRKRPPQRTVAQARRGVLSQGMLMKSLLQGMLVKVTS